MDHSPFAKAEESDEKKNARVVTSEINYSDGDSTHLAPALEAAIKCDKLDKAQLLIDRGSGASLVNYRPFLWHCANYNQCDAVRILLKAGNGTRTVNVNRVNDAMGETASYLIHL